MVGTMLLLKMLHCQRMNGRFKNKLPFDEKSTDKAGSSQDATALDSRIKIEQEICEKEICRICLKEGDIPIYGDGVYDDNSEEFIAFSGIEVSINDPYPKFLCQLCNSLLEGAILFRKTAQRSDAQLKQTKPPLHLFKLDKNEEPDCNDTDDSPMDYEDITTKKDIYDCAKCNKQFKSLQYYYKHIDRHNVKRSSSKIKRKKIKVTESFDEQVSDNNVALDTEAEPRKKMINKINYCSKCKLTFDTFKEYNEHRMSDEHENMRHICPICHQSYAPLYFKKHLSLHKGETPYMCDICGKNFTIQGQFNRHRLTHFYELPFKCTLCPYKGRFQESLRMHMRTHTGEKPYQCSQCPSRFTNKSNLNKHMRTHKGDHDFKCDTCGRGFYTKRELELHIKVDHTGMKDHICGICGKAFGYRKQMMKHQLKVHKRAKMKSGRIPLYLKVENMKKLGQDVEAKS